MMAVSVFQLVFQKPVVVFACVHFCTTCVVIVCELGILDDCNLVLGFY